MPAPGAALLRFRSLGSGSSGNATLVEARDAASARALLMIDCGFTLRELTARLLAIDIAPAEIDALFVTHEHGDHVGCALALHRRHGVPLWMSRGTWRAIGSPELDAGQHRFVRDGDQVALGPLTVAPFTVPHDAAEPLQLHLQSGGWRLGVLTDAGSITEHLIAHLSECDALLLEFNHDCAMLAASSYPASLKARISSRHGHLSNDTAARILERCLHAGLRHVVAAHLSEQTNHPDRVREWLARVCGDQVLQTHVACQASGFDWITLD